jgi:hypothetical protein
VTPEAAIAELLRSRGAADIDHPGGTLYDHLARVQKRLADLGAPETVQLAGRAHAVYGTDGFAVPLLELDERPLLAAVVGDEVEHLVYRYCACDRRESWGALADTGRIRDRFTGDSEVLVGRQLRAFADLSIVNELDVAEHSASFLDEHGEYFRRLTTAWEPLLSAPILAAARAVFG